jgi:hypothetical protein
LPQLSPIQGSLTTDAQTGCSTGHWVFTGANVCSEADLSNSRFRRLRSQRFHQRPVCHFFGLGLEVGRSSYELHVLRRASCKRLSRAWSPRVPVQVTELMTLQWSGFDEIGRGTWIKRIQSAKVSSGNFSGWTRAAFPNVVVGDYLYTRCRI